MFFLTHEPWKWKMIFLRTFHLLKCVLLESSPHIMIPSLFPTFPPKSWPPRHIWNNPPSADLLFSREGKKVLLPNSVAPCSPMWLQVSTPLFICHCQYFANAHTWYQLNILRVCGFVSICLLCFWSTTTKKCCRPDITATPVNLTWHSSKTESLSMEGKSGGCKQCIQQCQYLLSGFNVYVLIYNFITCGKWKWRYQ